MIHLRPRTGPSAWKRAAVAGALAASALLSVAPATGNAVEPLALCVNPSGTGGCLRSIQAGVNAAAPGATIAVAAGVYRESVSIATPVTLRGAGRDETTLDAGGADNVVHIIADGVRIEGFTLIGARLDGILVNGNWAQIVGNFLTGNAELVIPPPPGQEIGGAIFNNINLQNASDALVANNIVTKSNGRGIRTEGSAIYNAPDYGISKLVVGRSDRNLIINNEFSENAGGCGIVLSTDSSDNIVIGNLVRDNTTGLVVSNLPPFGLAGTPFADRVPQSNGNIIMNNVLEGNPTEGIGIHPISGMANGNVVVGNTVRDNGPCPVCGPASIGIYVAAGALLPGFPDSTAEGNVVGPNNVVEGQEWGIAVIGDATNTQVSGNVVSVPAGGTAVRILSMQEFMSMMMAPEGQ